jgi:hypothetical protein
MTQPTEARADSRRLEPQVKERAGEYYPMVVNGYNGVDVGELVMTDVVADVDRASGTFAAVSEHGLTQETYDHLTATAQRVKGRRGSPDTFTVTVSSSETYVDDGNHTITTPSVSYPGFISASPADALRLAPIRLAIDSANAKRLIGFPDLNYARVEIRERPRASKPAAAPAHPAPRSR